MEAPKAVFRRLVALLLSLTVCPVSALDGGTSIDCHPSSGTPSRSADRRKVETERESVPRAVDSSLQNPGKADVFERSLNLSKYASVQDRCMQDPSLTFVVAISGGGLRATNFALGALLALEHVPYGDYGGQTGNLHSEVDYFSTVSGGGLAAAASVVARLHAGTPAERMRPLRTAFERDQTMFLEMLRPRLYQSLALSLLKPHVLFGRPTRGDELQLLLDRTFLCPFPDRTDCKSLRPDQSLVLGSVFVPDPGDTPTLPYWFINATDMETGEIIPFTPEYLARRRVASYWHGGNFVVDPNKGGHYRVPLALALRSSMNFRVFMPATRLAQSTGDDSMYLTDGGQSDNLGVVTATAALAEDRRRTSKPNRGLLVVIDAHQGTQSDLGRRPTPPNALRSLYRATSLTLDAHRFRVHQDYAHADANQLSVLDALSDTADLAVAYVDLTREHEARGFGTFDIPDVDEQRELICAGARSALSALGLPLALISETNVGEGSCEEGEPPPDRGRMVLFNRHAKDRFATSLLEALNESRVAAMRAVDEFINVAKEVAARALLRKELEDIDDVQQFEAGVSIEVPAGVTGKMTMYKSVFDALPRAIEKLDVQPPEDDDDSVPEDEDGKQGADQSPEEGVVARVREAIAKWGAQVADVVWGFLAYVGLSDEDSEAGDPEVDEEVRVFISGDVREKVLGILDDKMTPRSTEVEELLRKSTKVTDGDLKKIFSAFDEMQLAQRRLVVLLEGERTRDPRLVAHFRLTKVYDQLFVLADLRRLMERKWLERLAEAMRRRGDEYVERFERARKDAREQLFKYEQSDEYLQLKAVWQKLSGRRAEGGGGHDVCERLLGEERRVKEVLNDLPSVDVADEGRMSFLPALPSPVDRDALSERLGAARSKVRHLADEARRVACLYPDPNRRDEIGYMTFRGGDTLFDEGADCGVPKAYERACSRYFNGRRTDASRSTGR